MAETRTLENPLTGSDRKDLKDAKARLNRVIDYVEKLEQAGINCDERRDLCQTLHAMIEGLESVFPKTPAKVG